MEYMAGKYGVLSLIPTPHGFLSMLGMVLPTTNKNEKKSLFLKIWKDNIKSSIRLEI